MNEYAPPVRSDALMETALTHPADAAGWRSMECAPRMPDEPFVTTRLNRPYVLILFKGGDVLECTWHSSKESDNPGWWHRNKPIRAHAVAWRPMPTYDGPDETTLLRSEAYHAEVAALRFDGEARFYREVATTSYEVKRSPWRTEEDAVRDRDGHLAKAREAEASAKAERAKRDDLLRREKPW